MALAHVEIGRVTGSHGDTPIERIKKGLAWQRNRQSYLRQLLRAIQPLKQAQSHWELRVKLGRKPGKDGEEER